MTGAEARSSQRLKSAKPRPAAVIDGEGAGPSAERTAQMDRCDVETGSERWSRRASLFQHAKLQWRDGGKGSDAEQAQQHNGRRFHRQGRRQSDEHDRKGGKRREQSTIQTP